MKRILVLTVLLPLVSIQAAAQAFTAGCTLRGHLKTLSVARPIDSTCPRRGAGSSNSQAQNRAKNNFCASNIPVEITIPKLRKLDSETQEALTDAGIPFGHPTTIPPNRDRLEQGFTVDGVTFREGMAVFIRAFVLESHYSNVGNGEAVNCNKSKQVNNDIHISLVTDPDNEECEGVTAEISPHRRPTSWASFDDYLFTHPVMIMGHLFYDASHKPCSGANPQRPFRSSSWEIHPVYSIYVCKNATLAACPSNPTDSRWEPFHMWVTSPDDETPGHHRTRFGAFWAIKELLYESDFTL